MKKSILKEYREYKPREQKKLLKEASLVRKKQAKAEGGKAGLHMQKKREKAGKASRRKGM